MSTVGVWSSLSLWLSDTVITVPWVSHGQEETEIKESNFEQRKSSVELSNGGELTNLLWFLQEWFLSSLVSFQILYRVKDDVQQDRQNNIKEQTNK